MIDNIKLANYKSFFADQVKEAIDEQQKINRSQMRNLFKTGELSLAYVDSIQHETGMKILIVNELIPTADPLRNVFT